MRYPIWSAIVVGMALCGVYPAAAQDDLRIPVITGVRDPSGKSRLGEEPVSAGAALESLLKIEPDAEVMIYSPTGKAALILRGPAAIEARLSDEALEIDLLVGALTVVSEADAGAPVRIAIIRNEQTVVSGPLARGRSYWIADPKGDRVALETGAGSLELQAGADKVNLAAGQSWKAGAAPGSAADVRSEWKLDADSAGAELGVAAARNIRRVIEEDLFENVISWDKRAQESAVREYFEPVTFKPEVRTVAFAVTTVGAVSSNRFAAPTASLQLGGANAVPVISPAASSVGGVTAVQAFNAQAVALVTANGSQGLGFRGLAQLALPGFLNGFRSTTPAGLAGTR